MSTPPRRLIAIGDVHGCVHALDALLDAIAPTRADRLVFLGDLVDQGPDSRDVLDRVIDLGTSSQVVLIEGNHEEMMLAARDNAHALAYWEVCGGATTLSSYRLGGHLSDIPDEHWELIRSGQPYFETDHAIFTHANYQHDLPMPEHSGRRLRWELFDPAEAQPHMSGKPVVLGHTEQRDGEILDLGFAQVIDTACCRYGWLTAIDVLSGHIWQASKWGLVREVDEASHREPLAAMFAAARDVEAAPAVL
jgi:serine/threonine protein phosphatase 1